MSAGQHDEPTPVFVDVSGRRAGRVAWLVRVVTALVVLYIALLIASLARAPFVPKVGLHRIGIPPVAPVAPPSLGPGAVASPQPTAPPPTTAPSPATTTTLARSPSGATTATTLSTPGASSPGNGALPAGAGTTNTTPASPTTSAPGNSGDRGRRSTTTTNPRRP